MIHIMVSFSEYQNSIFVDRVPLKHKNYQLLGVLQISVQISTFSHHMQKVEIYQVLHLKKDMLHPFL